MQSELYKLHTGTYHTFYLQCRSCKPTTGGVGLLPSISISCKLGDRRVEMTACDTSTLTMVSAVCVSAASCMYYSPAALLPANCLSPTACELVAVPAHICLVSSLVACCCVDLRPDDCCVLPTRASAVNSICATAQLLFVCCILHFRHVACCMQCATNGVFSDVCKRLRTREECTSRLTHSS